MSSSRAPWNEIAELMRRVLELEQQLAAVCVFDCIYKNTDGCRVHNLGVRGITSCDKFKEK